MSINSVNISCAFACHCHATHGWHTTALTLHPFLLCPRWTHALNAHLPMHTRRPIKTAATSSFSSQSCTHRSHTGSLPRVSGLRCVRRQDSSAPHLDDHRCIDSLTTSSCMTDCLTAQPPDLIHSLILLTGRLSDSFTHCLSDCLAGRLAGWSTCAHCSSSLLSFASRISSSPPPLCAFILPTQLTASLTALRTKRFDVLYLHQPDAVNPLADSLKCCSELVAEGLIGTVGLSNYSVAETERVIQICKDNGYPTPTVFQGL